MKMILLMSLTSIFLISCSTESESIKHSYIPKQGFVADAETAKLIAEAIWKPIYGSELVNSEKPFNATLDNGIWLVSGSLPPNTVGGVVLAKIAQSDGRIILVTHEK